MVYILIPMYNEELNLPNLHARLLNVLPDYQKYFVFVDDCSSDTSVKLIHQLFQGTDFTVLTKEKNEGPGHSFNLGMEWVIAHSKNIEKDILVTMEADCTSDVEILLAMVTLSKLGYDFVLASVYAQGGGFQKTSFLRKSLSFAANMLFRAIYDVKVLTLSSFYRVYSLSSLQKIKAKYGILIKEPGFICMFELLIKAISIRATTIEVPMQLKSDERKGKSKMKVLKTSASYVRFLLSFKKK